MSFKPEEQPIFNFNAAQVPTYDPVQIAEAVLWPVVDAFTGRHWRSLRVVPHEEFFSRQATLAGAVAVASLRAATSEVLMTDHQDKPLYALNLEVETVQQAPERNMIFAKALRGHGPDLRGHDFSTLATKTGISLYVDSDEDTFVYAFQKIDTHDGETVWFESDRSVDMEIGSDVGATATLKSCEIEIVQNALYILQAPKSATDNLISIVNTVAIR